MEETDRSKRKSNQGIKTQTVNVNKDKKDIVVDVKSDIAQIIYDQNKGTKSNKAIRDEIDRASEGVNKLLQRVKKDLERLGASSNSKLFTDTVREGLKNYKNAIETFGVTEVGEMVATAATTAVKETIAKNPKVFKELKNKREGVSSYKNTNIITENSKENEKTKQEKINKHNQNTRTKIKNYTEKDIKNMIANMSGKKFTSSGLSSKIRKDKDASRNAENEWVYRTIESYRNISEIDDTVISQLVYNAYQMKILAERNNEYAQDALVEIFSILNPEDIPYELDENGKKVVSMTLIERLLEQKGKEYGLDLEFVKDNAEKELDTNLEALKVQELKKRKSVKELLKKGCTFTKESKEEEWVYQTERGFEALGELSDETAGQMIYYAYQMKKIAEKGNKYAESTLVNMFKCLELDIPYEKDENGNDIMSMELCERFLAEKGKEYGLEEEFLKNDAQEDLNTQLAGTEKNVKESSVLKNIVEYYSGFEGQTLGIKQKYHIVYDMAKLKILSDNGSINALKLFSNMNESFNINIPMNDKTGRADEDVFLMLLGELGKEIRSG